MEVLNKINEGLSHLKNKDIEMALELFSNAVALSGQNIEDEIKWAWKERNFEVLITICNSLFAFSWFLYSIKIVSKDEKDLLINSGKIEGILEFYKNILDPVITNLVEFLEKKEQSISRNLANNILLLKNGFNNLDTINKET